MTKLTREQIDESTLAYCKEDPSFGVYLQQELDRITEILEKLLIVRGEDRSLNSVDDILGEIEEWMGDDWYIDLDEKDEERLNKNRGWYYD
jgi:hypothetical protein